MALAFELARDSWPAIFKRIDEKEYVRMKLLKIHFNLILTHIKLMQTIYTMEIDRPNDRSLNRS